MYHAEDGRFNVHADVGEVRNQLFGEEAASHFSKNLNSFEQSKQILTVRGRLSNEF